jgi:hypothetical protein
MAAMIFDKIIEQQQRNIQHNTPCGVEQSGDICNTNCPYAHKVKSSNRQPCEKPKCQSECKKQHLSELQSFPWHEKCEKESSGQKCEVIGCNRLHIFVHPDAHHCLNGLNCTNPGCCFRHLVKTPKRSVDCTCEHKNADYYRNMNMNMKTNLCYCQKIYSPLSDWSDVVFEGEF